MEDPLLVQAAFLTLACIVLVRADPYAHGQGGLRGCVLNSPPWNRTDAVLTVLASLPQARVLTSRACVHWHTCQQHRHTPHGLQVKLT
jgi:hypothetical protein